MEEQLKDLIDSFLGLETRYWNFRESLKGRDLTKEEVRLVNMFGTMIMNFDIARRNPFLQSLESLTKDVPGKN